MFCCLKKLKLNILSGLYFSKTLHKTKNKCIKLYQDSNKKYYIIKEHKNRDLYKNELDILSDLYHKNIINIIYSQEYYKIGYLKLTYYKNGDLFNYFQRSFPWNINKVQIFFKQIVHTINYCHKRNIVHGDIKLENFVLNENFNPILIDFENSFRLPGQKSIITSYKISGTIGYLAPECYLFKIGYSSDIWSLGCLLYRFLFNTGPLNEYLTINDQIINYCDWDTLSLYINYPKKYSHQSLIQLLKKMLEPYPTNRITMEELLKHPFIIE